MLPHLLVIAILGFDPTPEDAFFANYQATRCSLEFTYRSGAAKTADVGRIWKQGKFTLQTELVLGFASGVWECDGHVERVLNRPAEELMERLEEERRAGRGTVRTPIEYLFDSEIVASHQLGSREVSVVPGTQTDIYLKSPIGPFSWGSFKFPEVLTHSWKQSTRKAFASSHGGYATQDVLYSKTLNETEKTLLVAFDPSVGFLPRYARTMAYSRADDLAGIEEMYLVDARRCSYGGWVPVEWIQARFTIPHFRAKHPNDSLSDAFECPTSELSAGWFRAERFDDKTSEPAVQNNEGLTHLTSWGGIISLQDQPKTLSLTEMRTKLGLKIFVSRPISHIQPLEAGEFDSPPNSRWKVWIASVGLVLIGCAFLFAGYRRYRSARGLLLILLLFVSGCAEPTPALQTSIDPEVLAYDWRSDDAPQSLKLTIRNTGNCSITIREVKPGCACSIADSSAFPMELRPTKHTDAEVTIQRNYSYARQSLGWTFVTNHGEIRCTSPLFMFPRARLSPQQQYHPALYPGDEHAFAVVVHQVAQEDEAFPATNLSAPDSLAIRQKETESNAGPAKGFKFRETSFDVVIVDQTLGAQKKEIALLAESGEKIAVAYVGWLRVPFVSTTPEKVYLAERSVRVFLRSKDEDVEFTRVIEVPIGVDAIVTSPREITVRPKPDASVAVDGTILVETNATKDSVVRIPVVRYLPDRSTPVRDSGSAAKEESQQRSGRN